MSVTVDTNILLYASNIEAPEHERGRSLVEHLAAGPALMLLLWPVVLGYLRLATHPAIFRSPFSPAEAAANTSARPSRPHVRAVGEVDGFWATYERVTSTVPTCGYLVPDAHLVALMHQHGIRASGAAIGDLRKFDGIAVADPFSAKFRAGFR